MFGGGRKGQNAVVFCSLTAQSPKPPIKKEREKKKKKCEQAENRHRIIQSKRNTTPDHDAFVLSTAKEQDENPVRTQDREEGVMALD